MKKVLPSDVWTRDILPHYANGASLPDLSAALKKRKRGPKQLPLDTLSPKTKHIRQRTQRILGLVKEEAYGQGITMTQLLGLLIHKINYNTDKRLAAIGYQLFEKVPLRRDPKGLTPDEGIWLLSSLNSGVDDTRSYV